jgi:hypothetical protein
MHQTGSFGFTTVLALFFALLPKDCQPPEPGPGPAPGDPNPVAWKTETVTLTADDFWIDVDGQRFKTMADLSVHSDPGWNHYTTLELSWNEHGTEQRLFVYFKSDGTKWWSEEIRTYDGKPKPEWIYYFGRFFDQPVGQPFSGDLDLHNNGPADTSHGVIHFKNLRLGVAFKSMPGPF